MAQIERLLDESRSDLSGVGGNPSTELLAEADEVWPLFQQQMQEFKGVLADLHDGCR